jgi:hypothetical protein
VGRKGVLERVVTEAVCVCVYKQALEAAEEMRRQTKLSLARKRATAGSPKGGGGEEEGAGKVFYVEWDSVSVGNLAAAHTNHRGGVMGINRILSVLCRPRAHSQHTVTDTNPSPEAIFTAVEMRKKADKAKRSKKRSLLLLLLLLPLLLLLLLHLLLLLLLLLSLSMYIYVHAQTEMPNKTMT